MDILEGIVQALREKDMELGFLEVDYPFSYFLKNEQNPAEFRDLQTTSRFPGNARGCRSRRVRRDPRLGPGSFRAFRSSRRGPLDLSTSTSRSPS